MVTFYPCRFTCVHECLPECRHVYRGMLGGQKKALDSVELELQDGCEALCGCQESKLGPLQEQQMLPTAELSLQPGPCPLDPWASTS